MELLEEATKYFKENDNYNRLFKGIKEKYISLGEVKGNVIINKPTKEEKQLLSGLMKKDYSRNSSISINLKKLQQRLDESKFSGVDIVSLLKQYFGQEILTKKENIKNQKDELEQFWKEILQENKNTYIYTLLEKSQNNKDGLYQNIKRYYKSDKENLKNDLLNACKGINYLHKKQKAYIEEKTRIPVFASKITASPHGFDKKTLCGKLLILLLCYINEVQYPKNSEELAELYYNNNLLVDDVSNMVLCKNIVAFAKGENSSCEDLKGKRYEMHQGLVGFNAYNEPLYLTLYNLSNLSYISEYNKYNKVLITENPAVFMEIMENCKIKDFPLMCTYGQVKLAGIMLMDLLVEKGYMLYYSGDLDPEGIQIADKLKQRYKDNLNLIGFNKEVYHKNISNVELSESRIQKLNNVKSKELEEICMEISKNKRASYEEENIEYLIEFIELIIGR